jgi:TP901 family phage tail tape measure protein
MAYNLPMQVSLQIDQGSITSLRRQIESGLGGIQVQGLDTKNFAKANAQIEGTTKNLRKGQGAAESFFDALEGRARGFVAYTIASTAILKLSNVVAGATREAIKFETELIKISQVTNQTTQRIVNQSQVLVDISKKYNITISKVALLTRTLTQTGLSFKEASKGAEILARTSLLATFDSLTSTTEGLIAVMQTFNLTVQQSGVVLDKINAVSKAFAVESSDIVEAIRRTGGAFSSAGGQIEELIALFTSVRSTTRESAETIATGFRTIFARLQRPKTIEYFKQLGIQLETAEGQFIGPLAAIEEIGKGLDRLGIKAGSVKFAEVVEQIGGIRQISRVIPLLEQYQKTQRALEIQNNASGESARDLEKAQRGLGYQLGTLKQDFTALINEVVNSDSFKFLAETFINFTKTIISLTRALKPLLPLLTAVLTVKIGRGLTQLTTGGFSLKGVKEAVGFASGGMVPGSGNGDTVPAMLTPGEFVIRKSAVQAFGADRLSKINKYAKGGIVDLTKQKPSLSKYYDLQPDFDNYDVDPKEINLTKKRQDFRAEAKKIWDTAVKETTLTKQNEVIQKATDNFSQMLGPAELDPNKQSESQLNKITGGLVEQYVQNNVIKNATKLTDEEGADFRGKDGKLYEVKSTKRKVSEKEIIAKAVLAEGIIGNYDDGVEQTVTPEIYHVRAVNFNKGGPVYEPGGVSEYRSIFDRTKSTGTKEKEFPPISLTSDGSTINAGYLKNDGSVSGYVIANKFKDNLFTVGLSKATKGFGPKLYDVAMEAVTQLGGMLTSDRSLVSKDAQKVWEYYFKNRGDVKKTPLDPSNWTTNPSLIDPKLYGKKETWPSTDDPAWTLQTGYSKSPSLIKDENLVKFSKYAKGGSVGTDTVPALLTPGEFVINKKSAQSFGYGNLEEINRYANGGIVQRFLNGGEAKKPFASMGGLMGEKARANPFTSMAGPMGAAAKKTAEAMNGVTKSAEKTSKALENTSKGFKTSILEMIFYAQSAASALRNFAGIEINQEAMQIASEKAGRIGTVGEIADRVDAESIGKFSSKIKNAGSLVEKFGSKVGGKFGGFLTSTGGKILKFGGDIQKYSGKIAGLAKGIGVVSKIIAAIELIGGLFDAAFGTNFEKLKENLIEAGDVAGAGAAAANAYNQRFYRGIPIIGGFLSGLTQSLPLTMQELDARGKLVVSTAELRASMVKLDKDITSARKNLSVALIRGQDKEIQSALDQESSAINSTLERALKVQTEAINLQKAGPDLLAKTLTGAVGGAVTGGLAGAGTAGLLGQLGPQVAFPEEIVTVPVAAAIGAVIGGITGGVTAFSEALTGHTDDIVAAFESAGAAFELAGQKMQERIEQLGNLFSSVVTQTILAGGSLEDATAKFKERFGDQAYKDLFGTSGVVGAEQLEAKIKSLGEEIAKAETSTVSLEGEIAKFSTQVDQYAEPSIWNFYTGMKGVAKESLAATEAELKRQQANKQNLEIQRRELVEAQAAAKNAEILKRARELENAAMRESIKLLKERISIFDNLNTTVLEMGAALDEVNAVRSGGLSRQGALNRRGIKMSATTLEMDPEQVLRDSKAFGEMLDAVSRLGSDMLTSSMLKGKKDLDVLNNIQDQMLGSLGQEVAKIRADAVEEARKSGGASGTVGKDTGQAITDKIISMLNLDASTMSAGLRNALEEFGQDLADGVEAGTSLEKLKGKLTEDQRKLIEETQKKYNEFIQAEQEYHNMQIEEVHRRYELAQKVYDAEKSYFEQRLALTEKVDDVLNPEPVGPGRAAFLGNRAAERRQNRMSGIQSARRAAGMPADTAGAERGVINGLNSLGSTVGENAKTFEELKAQGEQLLSTLQDEIAAEQDYLDGLIEMAKAQQEYTQALNDAQGELIRELVTGTDEEVGDMLNGLNAALLAASQGSLEGIPEDMRKQVFSIFDQFADVEIPGLGMTGRDAQREITKNDLMRRFGVDEATATQMASKAVKDRVPIDERMKEMIELQEKKILELLERERALKQAILGAEAKNNADFSHAVNNFGQWVDKLLQDLGRNEAGDKAAEQAASDLEQQQAAAAAAPDQQGPEPPKPDQQGPEPPKPDQATPDAAAQAAAAQQAQAAKQKELEEAKAAAKNQGERVIQATIDYQLASKAEQQASTGRDAKALKLRAEARKKAQANLDAAIKASDEARARVDSLSAQQPTGTTTQGVPTIENQETPVAGVQPTDNTVVPPEIQEQQANQVAQSTASGEQPIENVAQPNMETNQPQGNIGDCCTAIVDAINRLAEIMQSKSSQDGESPQSAAEGTGNTENKEGGGLLDAASNTLSNLTDGFKKGIAGTPVIGPAASSIVDSATTGLKSIVNSAASAFISKNPVDEVKPKLENQENDNKSEEIKDGIKEADNSAIATNATPSPMQQGGECCSEVSKSISQMSKDTANAMSSASIPSSVPSSISPVSSATKQSSSDIRHIFPDGSVGVKEGAADTISAENNTPTVESPLKDITEATSAANSTSQGFTPTGNIAVDALMSQPLDIKEGKERSNKARYRSRLDALRRAGANDESLDEFKSQYREKVYGKDNQQLYDYNKARYSGKAAYIIDPKERTPEQEARAQDYKNDILVPNSKTREAGKPIGSLQERAAEYQKRKSSSTATEISSGKNSSNTISAKKQGIQGVQEKGGEGWWTKLQREQRAAKKRQQRQQYQQNIQGTTGTMWAEALAGLERGSSGGGFLNEAMSNFQQPQMGEKLPNLPTNPVVSERVTPQSKNSNFLGQDNNPFIGTQNQEQQINFQDLAKQSGMRTDVASFTATGAEGRIQKEFYEKLKALRSRGYNPNLNNMTVSKTPAPESFAPQSRTSNILGQDVSNVPRGGSSGGLGGPVQVQTQGQQEITIRLPDIQALVNQGISGMIYETIGSYFTKLAGNVRSASNFEEVANSMENGLMAKENRAMGEK